MEKKTKQEIMKIIGDKVEAEAKKLTIQEILKMNMLDFHKETFDRLLKEYNSQKEKTFLIRVHEIITYRVKAKTEKEAELGVYNGVGQEIEADIGEIITIKEED